ncbi:unnamed protein product [Vitrella brassicaformis CCMP3155]|uniref:Uncharacterized protein n=2 Tax=Vitrella brassicaformis TaxID=1169539 RepID=A0A0G4FVK6_VITBC|nr:unnamed protein product [Vitrella brassicaformis CCMP3155]|eukprot:CEM18576.1 unnamed protein product [Vitrella brassicaformis CCMP3155]
MGVDDEVDFVEGEMEVDEAAAEGGQQEEEEEEIPELTEEDIIDRLNVEDLLEEGMEGVGEFFVNSSNFVRMGLVPADEPESEPLAFKYFTKQEAMQEVQRVGFNSDWHEHSDVLKKWSLEHLLLIRDPNRIYGQNYAWPHTPKAFQMLKQRIDELKQKVVDDYYAQMKGGRAGEGEEEAEGAEAVDEDAHIVVKDEPIAPQPWQSDTAEETAREVALLHLPGEEGVDGGKVSRRRYKVVISRKRQHFGAQMRFNDSAENIHSCRPQKDPNYALHRKELHLGIQAVPTYCQQNTQTPWFRPVNSSSQYNSDDFLNQDLYSEKELERLNEFLSRVAWGVEEALQQNETFDIYQDEFANLGDDDLGVGARSSASIREVRNFHDLTYSKSKLLASIDWLPGSTTIVAVSCIENMTFDEQAELSGKGNTAVVLVWSFHDFIIPQAVLVSLSDVSVIRFNPQTPNLLIGGCNSGQLVMWRIDSSLIGGAGGQNVSRQNTIEDDRSGGIPHVHQLIASSIDESHKKTVTGIQWVPEGIEFEKRGRMSYKKESVGLKYVISIAGDGQLLIWDLNQALQNYSEPDFVWRPIFHVQLQRQDSGTEMGCCDLLLPHCDPADFSCYFISATEEGELIYGDWGAKGEEDRKPEYVKKLLKASKSFRPTVALERSPFFPSVMLTVTDWAFYLWREGTSHPIFTSQSSPSHFATGVWSTSRPGVLYLGRMDGILEIWDFCDQSHKPSLTHTVTSVAITSLAFQKTSKKPDALAQLAVGDENGNLHILALPKNLTKQAGNEMRTMSDFFAREDSRVEYCQAKLTDLRQMAEELEKKKQMDGELMEITEIRDDEDKLLERAEAEYRALEKQFKEALGLSDEPPNGGTQ